MNDVNIIEAKPIDRDRDRPITCHDLPCWDYCFNRLDPKFVEQCPKLKPPSDEHREREGSWKDVRQKAKRLKAEGAVTLIRIDSDVVAAKVVGDNSSYDTVLYRQFPKSGSVTLWTCSCQWGNWAFNRTTYNGRMCSHALATLYAAHGTEFTKSAIAVQTTDAKTFYHISPREYRESILEHGIDATQLLDAGWPQGYPSWITDNYDTAKDIADAWSGGQPGRVSKPVDIHHISSEGLTAWPDPHGNYSHSWVINGPIPPKNIIRTEAYTVKHHGDSQRLWKRWQGTVQISPDNRKVTDDNGRDWVFEPCSCGTTYSHENGELGDIKRKGKTVWYWSCYHCGKNNDLRKSVDEHGNWITASSSEEPKFPHGSWTEMATGSPQSWYDTRKAQLVPIDDVWHVREYTRTDHRERIDTLKQEIQERGLDEPLSVGFDMDTGKTLLHEGNHRLLALKELGYTHVPVIGCRGVYPNAGREPRVPLGDRSKIIQYHPDRGSYIPGSLSPEQMGFRTLDLPPVTGSKDYSTSSLHIYSKSGKETIMYVEVASHPQAIMQGLMHREYLPWDAGMVFKFDHASTTRFWMRNTFIPLSVAFWNHLGEIIAIIDMDPCNDAANCPSYGPNEPYWGAVEVNQGFFESNDIAIGDKIVLIE